MVPRCAMHRGHGHLCGFVCVHAFAPMPAIASSVCLAATSTAVNVVVQLLSIDAAAAECSKSLSAHECVDAKIACRTALFCMLCCCLACACSPWLSSEGTGHCRRLVELVELASGGNVGAVHVLKESVWPCVAALAIFMPSTFAVQTDTVSASVVFPGDACSLSW
uniref:Uncharacterized protein n=1 Tax=Chlamydomonas euryale TaxID=1486919 RepID=A0A7R9VBF4_9CHLO